ncbi:MAG: hypothetical protein EBS21_04365 [Sphingomonadaceae bacterium]|nr:hypothetical protein [Sphingomonadaceae bacterium]
MITFAAWQAPILIGVGALFGSQGYIACAINFGFIGIPKAIADINRVTSILSEDRLNLYFHQISSQTHGRAQRNIDLIPFP